VPADFLLVFGSCITNEAMLSGESTPQLKEGCWMRDEGVVDVSQDKIHIVYGVLLADGGSP